MVQEGNDVAARLEDLSSLEILKSCPICDTPHFREIKLPDVIIGREYFGDVIHQLKLVRCRGCGHIYQKIRPSQNILDGFYKTSSEYNPFGNARDSIGSIADAVRLDFIKRYNDGGTLLDFGGGGGRFAKSAVDSGIDAMVVELSPIGRKQCAARNIQSFPDIESVSDHVDVVSIIHVLEHVPFPVDTLKSIVSDLNVNGVYIEVPNLKSLRARVFPMIKNRCPNDSYFRAFPTHLHGFTQRSLDIAVKRAGMAVAGWMTYGGGFEIHNSNNSISVPSTPESSSIAVSANEHDSSRSGNKKLMKHVLFRSLLLGENLCAFCVPK
jgi:hypothetical protein